MSETPQTLKLRTDSLRIPAWRLTWNGTEKFSKQDLLRMNKFSITSQKIQISHAWFLVDYFLAQIYLRITWLHGSRVASIRYRRRIQLCRAQPVNGIGQGYMDENELQKYAYSHVQKHSQSYNNWVEKLIIIDMKSMHRIMDWNSY